MTAEASRIKPGMVYIVGAGPAAADSLTLRALDRIRRAEVVVHDRLIYADVMAQIPPRTERIYVGKASGHHTMPQEQINVVLVEQARKGRLVIGETVALSPYFKFSEGVDAVASTPLFAP